MKTKLHIKFLVCCLLILVNADVLQATVYMVGTPSGANTSTTYPTAYGNYYYGARQQFIIRAAELTGACAVAGPISSLGFSVTNTNASAPLTNYTIKMKLTSAVNTDAWDNTGLTTVYTNALYVVAVGWNTHAISPFNWDGTSNILIEVCFNNTNFTSNASTQWSIPSAGVNSSRVYYQDAAGVCANNGQSGVSFNRPIMQLNIPAGPAGPDLAVTNIFNPDPVVDLNSTNTVTARIRNSACSSTSITSCTVNYQWNTDAIVSQAWTGFLGIGASTTFSFSTTLLATPAGLNTLKVWTTNPNGVADVQTSNDMFTLPVWVAQATVIATAAFQGNDFWVGFLSNADNGATDPNDLLVQITSISGASGVVCVPGAVPVWSQPFTCPPLSVITVTVPNYAAQSGPGDINAYKGVRISSDSTIVCYAGNYQAYSSDAATAIPTNALGLNYHISSMAGYPTQPNIYSHQGPYGEFIVIGTEDNTTVTVNLTNPSNTMLAGVNYSINLDKGETWQIMGKDVTNVLVPQNDELTGSTVSANKPIAVYAGVECPYIGAPYCDHLFEQVRPNFTWGTEHYLAYGNKGGTYNAADVVRVYAPAAASVVVNGSPAVSIPARGFQDFLMNPSTGMTIISSTPVHVSQVFQGSQASVPPDISDPLMMDILPTAQWASNYIFATSSYFRFQSHFATIIIDAAQTGSLLLNGSPLTGVTWIPILPGFAYSFGYKTLALGTAYTLTSGTSTPFGLYVYGQGSDESYGFLGGGFLLDITPPPLPIELTTFTGINASGVAQLDWVTVSETNNDYFVIEKSSDAINFNSIIHVDGAGNSTEEIHYRNYDSEPLPSSGTAYYRLKQVDFDGKFSYSRIVAISNSSEDLHVNLSTDADGNMVVNYQSKSSHTAMLKVSDITGKLLHTQEIKINTGGGMMKISTANLSQGIYMFEINGQNISGYKDKFVKM